MSRNAKIFWLLILFFALIYAYGERTGSVQGFGIGDRVLISASDGKYYRGKITRIGIFDVTVVAKYFEDSENSFTISRSDIVSIRETEKSFWEIE